MWAVAKKLSKIEKENNKNNEREVFGVHIITKSDVGKLRKNNEDFVYAAKPEEGIGSLFLVADGMGGTNAGEVASHTAAETFIAYCKENQTTETLDLLVGGLVSANKEVYEKSFREDQYAEMGTTMVVGKIVEKKLYLAYIGDSRGYLFHNGALTQLTTDHSYVMELVRMGNITLEEAKIHPKRNLITRAIGVAENLEVDTIMANLEKNDVVLLCTDGLTTIVSDEEIHEILLQSLSLEKQGQALISLANEKGGQDNISVVLVHIEE